jgi:hypothetical protein
VVDPQTAEPTSTAGAFDNVSDSFRGYGSAPATLTALHPCGTADPDRDGDGVPDATDPYPLDASRPSQPTDPPPGPLTVEIRKGPKHATRHTAARFRFGSEGASGYECKVDSRPFRACGASTILRRLRDGRHRIAVRALDSTGRHGQPVSYRWLVDSKAPKVRFRGHADKKGAARVRITFKVKDRTTVRKLSCRVDQRGWRRCHSPYRTPRLSPGRHHVQVRAIDKVGNVAKEKLTVRIKQR